MEEEELELLFQCFTGSKHENEGNKKPIIIIAIAVILSLYWYASGKKYTQGWLTQKLDIRFFLPTLVITLKISLKNTLNWTVPQREGVKCGFYPGLWTRQEIDWWKWSKCFLRLGDQFCTFLAWKSSLPNPEHELLWITPNRVHSWWRCPGILDLRCVTWVGLGRIMDGRMSQKERGQILLLRNLCTGS